MTKKELPGDSTSVDLDDGISLTAPGLVGLAETGTTLQSLATPGGQLLEHALLNAGFEPRPPVLVTHTTSATGEVALAFPAPKVGNHAVLLVQDSTGALSLHRPDGPTAASAAFFKTPSGGEGASGHSSPPASTDLSFTVSGNRFRDDHIQGGQLARLARGLHHFNFHPEVVGAKKIFSVLEYPIQHLADWGTVKWIDHWDQNKHPTVTRWFPARGGQTRGEPLSPTNWATLDQPNRALLFIHGIFSSCNGAFGAIGRNSDKDDQNTWAELRKLYDGRIIGYDHPTVSVGPEQNALKFLEQIPAGVTLDVDIVCHSRGGLVARALAGQIALPAEAASKIKVGKIVFAATPNGGSAIANTALWDKLVSRISSLLTLPAKFLPAPADEITSILAGLLEVLKALAIDSALKLPGLEDMAPDSDLLKQLSSYTGSPPEYFAAASDFEPGPLLANLFHKLDDEARVVDEAIFPGVKNDIAVPTNGVWDPANPSGSAPPPTTTPVPGFPIPTDRRLPIGPGDVYWHSAYFEDPLLRAALVRWLKPGN